MRTLASVLTLEVVVVTIEEALAGFAGEDTAARRAYGWLYEYMRPYLHKFLMGKGLQEERDAETRDDIIQDTYIKLWERRSTFQNRGSGAWYKFVTQMAYHTFVDFVRARKREREHTLTLDDDLEIPDDDLPVIEQVIESLSSAMEAGNLYHLASVLWLGLDRALSEETHNRQILAAQLFYLDGEPWEEALAILNGGRLDDLPLTDAVLEAWLTCPGVLRAMAYHELYYSNDRLAGHLLALGEENVTAALNALTERTAAPEAEDAPPGGWTWAETAVILWRYREAFNVEQILRKGCPLTRAQIEALLERSEARFPFKCQMENLLVCLQDVQEAARRAALCERSLWQRLAFQYWYNDDISLRDVLARMEPAAQCAGYPLTHGMLNMWLSGGRLVEALTEFAGIDRGPAKKKKKEGGANE